MMIFLKRYLSVLLIGFLFSCQPAKIKVLTSENTSIRATYGAERLEATLTGAGYQVKKGTLKDFNPEELTVVVGERTDSAFSGFVDAHHFIADQEVGKEGFTVKRDGNTFIIAGADASGALYGCIELQKQIQSDAKLPEKINLTDQPEMVMRGTCVGLQKPTYLPGRGVYEYPITPQNFPWFYNKQLWLKYLDMMVEDRYNTLYLWNGHPFASLVKLKDYPYAVEVDEETFRMNEEIFSFLTHEADKRGIWVVQMFYNIIVSKPFAEKNGLKTQDRSRPIIPIIADYTRKSIAAFIEKYPHVGLLVTLGEAMNTIDDDVEWFTKTIIPGVQDGLKALGRTDEPPIVLRGHDTDAKQVMDAALPLYKNLYTMFKYNGESLTTYQPRDSWITNHTNLSKLGSVHISNVHILANLEPFRYGSPDFIQKCAQAMINLQGAKGLHLYPQASYWDWPYSADKTNPRLLEMDRDWIWYKAWGRYAWNSARDSTAEVQYWTNELGNFYGCGDKGKNILAAYEQTGEIAPKLLRTFGISDGNRQTLLLGMFMGQLVNPYKYNVYPSFWSSSGPVKEVLLDYAEKEWKGEKHVGETPPQVIQDVVERGAAAVAAIDEASSFVTENEAEFARLKNDIYCYNAFANFFAEKVKAAMLVLRFRYSKNPADLDKALPFLEKSLEYYRKLVDLTKDTYLYANSMQTQQRRIPVSGAGGKNKTWAELLPQYQTELDNFKHNLEMLKSGHQEDDIRKNETLKPAKVTLLNKGVTWYPLQKGQKVYGDREFIIEDVAPELKDLKGVRLNEKTQEKEGTVLQFKNEKPVKVLVGYFNTNSSSALSPPTLETNANANDRGQADMKIANAMLIRGLYPVNIYTYDYEAGQNELRLGKGRVLILGFIDGNENIRIHDAGITDSKDGTTVDWLFY